MTLSNLLSYAISSAAIGWCMFVWGRLYGTKEGTRLAAGVIEQCLSRARSHSTGIQQGVQTGERKYDTEYLCYALGYEKALEHLVEVFKPQPLTVEEITPRK